MSSIAEVLTTQEPLYVGEARPERARSALGYLRRNPSLGIGLLFLVGLLLFVVIGHLTVDTIQHRPLSARPPSSRPSLRRT